MRAVGRWLTMSWLVAVAAALCAAPVGAQQLAGPAAAQQLAGAAAWADSARRAIHAATVRADLDRLAAARALVERALVAYPDDPWLLHYLGYALYREAVLRRERRGEDVGALFERAEQALERSAELRPLPESYALLASILGQRIHANPLQGILLGPRSSSLMDRALALGPENPRVWLLKGISAIFTPSLFGGGLERAEEALRRAIALFEADGPVPPAPDWGRDEAWAWLGEVYRRRGLRAEARAAYEKALAIEPENVWVRAVLMPLLERSGSGNRSGSGG